jgi:hypothetical protein
MGTIRASALVRQPSITPIKTGVSRTFDSEAVRRVFLVSGEFHGILHGSLWGSWYRDFWVESNPCRSRTTATFGISKLTKRTTSDPTVAVSSCSSPKLDQSCGAMPIALTPSRSCSRSASIPSSRSQMPAPSGTMPKNCWLTALIRPLSARQNADKRELREAIH